MPYKDPEEHRRHLKEKRESDPEWHERKKQYQREWYAENRERELAKQKAKRDAMSPEERSEKFRPKTPEKLAERAAYQREYYRKHPELRNKYSRTRNQKLRKEREKAAGRPYPDRCENMACGRKCSTHWDHDNGTKKFRMYLCPNCNKLQGLAQHRPEILRGLADLLEHGGHGSGTPFHEPPNDKTSRRILKALKRGKPLQRGSK